MLWCTSMKMTINADSIIRTTRRGERLHENGKSSTRAQLLSNEKVPIQGGGGGRELSIDCDEKHA